MKMKPMGDQLLLKAHETQTKTKSGIILSSTNDVYGYADVIDAGPGLFTQSGDRIPMTCKKGDTVIAPSRLLTGKNGNEIKNLSQKARLEMEKFLKRKVHLFLKLKVNKG